MADNRIAIDTGPLILLAKIDALNIAASLPHQFVAPQNVMDELAAGVAGLSRGGRALAARDGP